MPIYSALYNSKSITKSAGGAVSLLDDNNTPENGGPKNIG